MNHIACRIALLAALVLGLAAPVRAETVTFLGKSFSPIKYDINWPFTTKAKEKDKNTQGSGIVANVHELPTEKFEEKSAAELGSDMPRLHILQVPVKVGQHVAEDDVLVVYEMPLENIIQEKEALSRAKLDDLDRALAFVNYQLNWLEQHQEDLEKNAELQAVAPQTVRANTQEIEALLKQRAYLTDEYELAKSSYENALVIAQSKYGKDVSVRNFPKKGIIRSPSEGYVLWENASLVPGMTFTKQAHLIAIGRLDPIIIRASVHEIAVQKLKLGDPATVSFHSLPGQTFTTTISKINYVAQPAMMQQPSFYEIELTLANPDLRIKEGMRCDVTVNLPDAPK